MKKILLLFIVGITAGALDLIPLIIVNAPLYNMLSIISFWLVTTYVISITTIIKNFIINGLIISILLMLPMALAVSAYNPKDFVPMIFMAILLGPIVGFLIGKINNLITKV